MWETLRSGGEGGHECSAGVRVTRFMAAEKAAVEALLTCTAHHRVTVALSVRIDTPAAVFPQSPWLELLAALTARRGPASYCMARSYSVWGG